MLRDDSGLELSEKFKLAIQNNDITEIENLIGQRDVNEPYGRLFGKDGDDLSEYTPLFHAVMLNKISIVKFLIENGANVELVIDFKKVLDIALEKHYTELIIFLSIKTQKLQPAYSHMKYLLSHKYDSEYLEELKLFVREITNQTQYKDLVSKFWYSLCGPQEDIEVSNNKLILLMQLLPCAVNAEQEIDQRIENIEYIKELINNFISYNNIVWDRNYKTVDTLIIAPHNIWLPEHLDVVLNGLIKENFIFFAKLFVTNNLSMSITTDHIYFDKHQYKISGNYEERLDFIDRLILTIKEEYHLQRKTNSLKTLYPHIDKISNVKLSITQVKHNMYDGTSSPDTIWFVLKRISIFCQEVILKFDQNLQITHENLKAWNDIHIEHNYFQRTKYISLNDQEALLAIVKNTDRATLPITNLLLPVQNFILNFFSMSLHDLWLENPVTYRFVLEKETYDSRESTWKIENIENVITKLNGEIIVLQDYYKNLGDRIQSIEERLIALNIEDGNLGVLIQDLKEGILFELNAIERWRRGIDFINHNNREILEKLESRIFSRGEYADWSYDQILKNMEGREKENAVLWSAIKTLEVSQSHLLEKFAKLQPLIAFLTKKAVSLEEIIENYEFSQQQKRELEALFNGDDGQYNKEFYHYFVQSINAVYLASSVISTGIVQNVKSGNYATLNSIIQAIAPHIPFAGIAVQICVAVLAKLESNQQKKALDNFFNIVTSFNDIDEIAKYVAQSLLKAQLDNEKLHEPQSLLTKLLNVIKLIVDNISDLEKIFKTANKGDYLATAGLTASTAISAEMISLESTQQSSKGKKHAEVIATLLISKIYNGEVQDFLTFNNHHKAEYILGLILEEFEQVSTIAIAKATEITNAVIETGRTLLAEEKLSEGESKAREFNEARLKENLIKVLSSNAYRSLVDNPLDDSQISQLISNLAMKFYVDHAQTQSLSFAQRIREVLSRFSVIEESYSSLGRTIVHIQQNAPLVQRDDDSLIYYVNQVTYNIVLFNHKNIVEILKLIQQKSSIIGIELINLPETEADSLLSVELAEKVVDQIIQQNFFLCYEKGKEFIQYVADNFDRETLERILALGRDFDIAQQIVTEADLQGIDRVVYTLLGEEIPEAGSINNLENIISTDELNQLQLIPNGILNSWSNKAYLRVVGYIDNLAKNLDSMLNVGKSGNQVAIIITLLEEWINFAASGQRLVSMPYFYHGDGDEDYPYGGGGGSENGSDNHNNSTKNLYNPNELIGVASLFNETNYINVDHQI